MRPGRISAGNRTGSRSLAIASDFGSRTTYRQYDRSIEFLKKTIDMDPNFVRSTSILWGPYIKKGMKDEAFREMINGMVANGDSGRPYRKSEEIRYAASGFKGLASLDSRIPPDSPSAGRGSFSHRFDQNRELERGTVPPRTIIR